MNLTKSETVSAGAVVVEEVWVEKPFYPEPFTPKETNNQDNLTETIKEENVFEKPKESTEKIIDAKVEYNIDKTNPCIALFLFFIFYWYYLVGNYRNSEQLDFGSETFYKAFKGFHWVLIGVIVSLLSYTLNFALLSLWSHVHKIFTTTKHRKEAEFWNLIWMCYMIYFYVKCIILPEGIFDSPKLGEGSKAVSAMIQIIFRMKIHAVVRTYITKTFSTDGNYEEKYRFSTRMKNFLYYMVVPTLLYKNNYKKNKKIDWQNLLLNTMEALSIIYIIIFAWDKSYTVPFKTIGNVKLETWSTVAMVVRNALPTWIMGVLGYYLITKTVYNILSELTKFKSKKSTKNYPMSSQTIVELMDNSSRTIQEWLHLYYYSPMVYKQISKTKTLISVLLIASFAQENLTYAAYGVSLPLMIILFGLIHLLSKLLYYIPKSGKTVLLIIAYFLYLRVLSFSYELPIIITAICCFYVGSMLGLVRDAEEYLSKFLLHFLIALAYAICLSAYTSAYFLKFNCPMDKWVSCFYVSFYS